MIKDLYTYILILIKKWYLYLGVFPVFYSRIDFNFGIKLPEINTEYSNYIFIIAFFIASFNSWRELNKKFENEVDYEISYEILEINDGIGKNILKAKNEILELNKEIEKNKKKELDEIKKNSIIVGIGINGKKNLKNRITELEGHIEYLSEIEEVYKEWKKIIFYIKNTGIKFDKKININLLNKNGKILEDEEFENDIRYIPDYPEEQSIFNIHKNLFHPNNNKPPYREKINDYNYELRELHINDTAEIFHSGEGLIIGEGDFEFNFEIKSEFTKKSIFKNIKFLNNLEAIK